MSEKKRSVRVYVVNVGGYYSADWPPENAVEFIDWLSNKVAQVPDEYRAEATFNIEADSDSEDESPYARVQLSYLRPETDDEYAERLKRERDLAEATAAQELAQLAALKKKYGQ